MRSKLFAPGSRPELFSKALRSQADAVSVDLEDSVIESRKEEARAQVADWLKSPETLASKKTIIVRSNELNSTHFAADLLAITQPRLDMLNLPKVESAADVLAAIEVLEQAESTNGVSQPIGILANIETAKGLRLALEIATAHSRVIGLQLGLNDLFSSMSIDNKDKTSVHAVLFRIRMAAGEAGVFAYDGAFADIHDETGFCEEATMARRLGYLGKSCIHPSQVTLANEVFKPNDDELAFAMRVVEASHEAESNGNGAFTLDGTMIDLPAVKRAELIINSAQRSSNVE